MLASSSERRFARCDLLFLFLFVVCCVAFGSSPELKEEAALPGLGLVAWPDVLLAGGLECASSRGEPESPPISINIKNIRQSVTVS